MSVNLIGNDVKLMRARYDEALVMRGIPARYQHPYMADTNAQGESVVEAYSVEIDTHIFFEGAPKVKTFKRLGWVVENDKDLPFLIHCSWNLPNMQKDAIFSLSGHYTGLPDRKFRVTEMTMDLQAPDHIICQVVPVYEKQTVGRTDKEVSEQFNKSHTFLKQDVDYRGNYWDPDTLTMNQKKKL